LDDLNGYTTATATTLPRISRKLADKAKDFLNERQLRKSFALSVPSVSSVVKALAVAVAYPLESSISVVKKLSPTRI
jgi:hypothetical protein